MDGNSSLGAVGAQAFDLDTQKGVTGVLVALRASDVSATEKNQIRDLVFQYTNGGKDSVAKEELVKKLDEIGLTPITISRPDGSRQSAKEMLEKRDLPFGSSRPTPAFSDVATKEIETKDREVSGVTELVPSPAPAPVSQTPPQVSPTPTPIQAPAQTSESVPVPSTPSLQQPPTQPSPTLSPEPPVAVPQPQATPQSSAPAPGVPATPTPPTQESPQQTSSTHSVNTVPQSEPPQPAPAPQTPPLVPPTPTSVNQPPTPPKSVDSPTPPKPQTTTEISPSQSPQSQSTQRPPVETKYATSTPPAPNPSMLAPDPEQAKYLARIREIKASVNQKVGNPVNLVDIDNNLGREYMNALLEAMKKLSAGSIGELQVSMQKLENAYVRVEKAIADHGGKVDAKVSKPTETVQPTPPKARELTQVSQPVNKPAEPATQDTLRPNVTPTAIPPTTPTSVTKPPASVTPPSVSPQTEAPRPVPTTLGSQQPPTQPSPTPSPEPPVTTSQLPVSPIIAPNTPPINKHPLSSQSTDESEAPPQPAVRVRVDLPIDQAKNQSDEVLKPPSFTPLSQDPNKLRTPDELPEASSLETGVTGDPLYTREVDDGLEQLLSDWDLFKRSGLFGTGPKGKEHPLFKKIAQLQIPLLLAGRFEGSTQEVKQSITDYMNGWRYEQGIIYEQGEVFEHYLRRVIKHILDVQKKQKGA